MAAFILRASGVMVIAAPLAVAVCCSAALGQSTGTLLAPPPPRTAAAGTAQQPADLKPSLPMSPTTAVPASRSAAPSAAALTPAFTADARAGLKVSKGAGILPNEHGQVWREYDLSPYTLRVRDVAKPEQAIVDWILRETGTEVWFT